MTTPARAADDRDEVARIVKKINQAWRNLRFDELGDYFHERMVIVPPEFAGRAEGRETCVQSYRDFVQQAKVLASSESQPAIDLSGDTAVAVCPFDITYELNGQQYTESGRDLFVFARTDGRWQAIWRTLFVSPRKG